MVDYNTSKIIEAIEKQTAAINAIRTLLVWFIGISSLVAIIVRRLLT